MTDSLHFDSLLNEAINNLSVEEIFDGPKFNHEWQKTPGKWRGRCPFHSGGSTGTSFYLNTERKLWRCPQCQVGGGVVEYIQRVNHGVNASPRGEEFIRIARDVFKRGGVTFPEKDMNPEQRRLQQRKQARKEMLQLTIEYCADAITNYPDVMQYFASRGIDAEGVQTLKIGYLDSPAKLLEHLQSKGFSVEEAMDVGLFYSGQHGTQLMSSLLGYAIIPWMDEWGSAMTLYGRWPSKKVPEGKKKTRALRNPKDKDAKHPWMETKNVPLFFHQARSSGEGEVVIVEGDMDASVAQVRGDQRVISFMGAEAGEAQVARLAKNKIKSAILCLDPDAAGVRGTISAISKLASAGITPFVTPGIDSDPDEYIIANGIEAWKAMIEESSHGFTYMANQLGDFWEEKNRSDRAKSAVLERAKQFAQTIGDKERFDELDTFFWPVLRGRIDDVGKASAETEFVAGNVTVETEFDFRKTIADLQAYIGDEPDEDLRFAKASMFCRDRDLRSFGYNPQKLLNVLEKEQEPELEEIDARDLMQLHQEGRPWLISGLLPLGSTGVIAAYGGTGKTTFLYHLAKHIALGKPWGDFLVKKGKVMIVQVDEPSVDISEKLNIQNFGEVPYGQVQFFTKFKFTQYEQLVRKIRKFRPSLVVIDSWTTAHIGTEIDLTKSSSGRMMASMRDLAEELGDMTFMAVHHFNKDGGLRDSSALNDLVSEVWKLKVPNDADIQDASGICKDNCRTLTISKSRSHVAGRYLLEQIPFSFSWKYHGRISGGIANQERMERDAVKYLAHRPEVRLTPSQIADNCGMPRNIANHVLQALKRKGMISRENSVTVKGDQTPWRGSVFFCSEHQADMYQQLWSANRQETPQLVLDGGEYLQPVQEPEEDCDEAFTVVHAEVVPPDERVTIGKRGVDDEDDLEDF